MSGYTLATSTSVFPSGLPPTQPIHRAGLGNPFSEAYRPNATRATIVDGSTNVHSMQTMHAQYPDLPAQRAVSFQVIGGQIFEDPQFFVPTQDPSQQSRDIQIEQMAKILENLRATQAALEMQNQAHTAERSRLAVHIGNMQKQLMYERQRYNRLLESYRRIFKVVQELHENSENTPQEYPGVKLEPDQIKRSASCDEL
ncbi:hypothetical protein EYR41_006084 [Orbilia oligospora]|uniref:Uncharacterized protein n=1 Tax=Orbilia oligospora TaxID=2813651 RepID=A0A8H2E3Q3_ORBOL|nr:hypothetical protein EYR41_006084 [Orbilia oligospora]